MPGTEIDPANHTPLNHVCVCVCVCVQNMYGDGVMNNLTALAGRKIIIAS